MNKIDRTLCIFGHRGTTYTFKNVTILINNQTILVFEYVSASDDYVKVGTFFKNNIMGYSFCDIPRNPIGVTGTVVDKQ